MKYIIIGCCLLFLVACTSQKKVEEQKKCDYNLIVAGHLLNKMQADYDSAMIEYQRDNMGSARAYAHAYDWDIISIIRSLERWKTCTHGKRRDLKRVSQLILDLTALRDRDTLGFIKIKQKVG